MAFLKDAWLFEPEIDYFPDGAFDTKATGLRDKKVGGKLFHIAFTHRIL
jgi:hypothetical protein